MILLSLFPAPHLRAQTGAPFSSLDFGLAAAANVNREGLHELWHSGHGALVRVSTPFYVGSAGQVGVSLMTSHRRVFTHVPIDFTYASAGLEYRQPTPLWLRDFVQ